MTKNDLTHVPALTAIAADWTKKDKTRRGKNQIIVSEEYKPFFKSIINQRRVVKDKHKEGKHRTKLLSEVNLRPEIMEFERRKRHQGRAFDIASSNPL